LAAKNPNTSPPVIRGPKLAEQISIREIQAKLEMEAARQNQLLNTPVSLAEAIRILDSGGHAWKGAASERFLWLMGRQAATISPAALLEAAVGWRVCRKCRDIGFLGTALKHTIDFCSCEIGQQERLDRGDEYIAHEIARVHETLKTRLVEACRELNVQYTADALEQSDTLVVEIETGIEIRPGAGAEGWCDLEDIRRALANIGDRRTPNVVAKPNVAQVLNNLPGRKAPGSAETTVINKKAAGEGSLKA
jgi:hypothetical protein